MQPPSSSRPVVLLTGASSGLGLAVARRLLQLPCRVILTAREESLHRFPSLGIAEGDHVHLRALDVTDARQREQLVAEAESRWGGVDALINNAGVAYRAVVEHWDRASWVDIVESDAGGPMALCALVLPGMRRKGAGRILNVSSVSGMMAMPTMSLYSAAKFALEGATEALWYEVRPWKIRVSLIQPGFIRSDSFRNTRFTRRSFRGVLDDGDPYHRQYLCMADFIERTMERALATPDTVAASIVRTLQRRRPPLRVYATPDAHLFALLRRILPRGVYHRFLYWGLPHVRTRDTPPG